MTREEFLSKIREVKETKDNKEAALLVQNGWVIIWSSVQGDDILWVLGRFKKGT